MRGGVSQKITALIRCQAEGRRYRGDTNWQALELAYQADRLAYKQLRYEASCALKYLRKVKEAERLVLRLEALLEDGPLDDDQKSPASLNL